MRAGLLTSRKAPWRHLLWQSFFDLFMWNSLVWRLPVGGWPGRKRYGWFLCGHRPCASRWGTWNPGSRPLGGTRSSIPCSRYGRTCRDVATAHWNLSSFTNRWSTVIIKWQFNTWGEPVSWNLCGDLCGKRNPFPETPHFSLVYCIIAQKRGRSAKSRLW